MQCEQFEVHSTTSKCFYLPFNHELRVSYPLSAIVERTTTAAAAKNLNNFWSNSDVNE